ncbi:MAG: hypothetical protein HY721_31065 [Planctomycetes bacterium]|nr:hypothetical protein [Planctomycetota bacterium]
MRPDRLLVLLVLGLVAPWILAAAAAVGTAAGASEPEGRTGERPGLARQASYSGLWPFFSHEAFEDGSEKWTSLLGAVRVNTEPDGDWHHHVLPFYCASLGEGRTDRQLGLYPLLYLGRRSPERDHDAVLPLFWRWRAEEARHVLLWPLLQAARNPEPAPFRWVPVLFRHGAWSDPAETRSRLGVPVLLEAFERSSAEGRRAWTILNAFNFAAETRSGLPVGKLSLSGEAGWHAHLFPLFSAGRREPESRYFHTPLAGAWSGPEGRRGISLPPLLTWAWWRPEEHHVHSLALFHSWRSERGEGLVAAPFYWAGEDKPSAKTWRFYSLLYGWVEDASRERRDHYLPLALSRYGREPDGYDLDVLCPLGHSSRRGQDASTTRALPFYDRKHTAEGDWLGVGGIVYRRHELNARGSVSHWVLLPLGRWTTWPEGHLAWALPVFYRRSETTDSGFARTTFVAPSFFSHRSERRWRAGAAGEAAGTGRTQEGRSARSAIHLWPVFGLERDASASKAAGTAEAAREWETKAFSTLYPFFQVSRRAGGTSQGYVETSVHAPWPFVKWRGDGQSFDLRLFPTLFVGDAERRTYLYLYPLLSVEEGPGAGAGFWHWLSLVHWHGGDDIQRFHLFPMLFLWRRQGETTRVTGPLWLYHYRDSPDGGWFHLFPLGFGRWGPRDSGFGVFPIVYRRHHGAEEVNYWNPARFFFIVNSLASEQEGHWSVLWKLVERTWTAGGDRELRVLHRLFVSRDVQGQRELLLNPLFHHFADERTGRRSFSILKFIYRSEVEGGEKRVSVLFIPIWRERVGGE